MDGDVKRPFRFGVSVRSATGAKDWRAKARRAQAAGFDTLLIADHLVEGMHAPLAPLVVVAEATDRLRVGTFVLNNDFRHPVVLAREAATVDLLTDGRLELGLGAGHMKFEYEEAGLRFDPPGVRVARMAESVEIIRRLLDGEEVTFGGEHYDIRGHRCFPVPARHVPLLVGGNGRRVLETAARQADIVGFTGFSQVEGEPRVNPSHFTDERLGVQIEWIRAAAGDRFAQLELNTLVQGITVTDDRHAAAAAVQGLVPSLTVDDILSSPYSLIGTAQEIADQMLDRRNRLGISYLTVFEKDLDQMADVIALIRASR
jgi:probable F420-dependent oxidoreductase